jgi:hypothetical protein
LNGEGFRHTITPVISPDLMRRRISSFTSLHIQVKVSSAQFWCAGSLHASQ